ncbi:MAG: UTP--glucose-1-phosphate uridylyltransferase [Ruminococcus sp.]|nr:UTP--glucose-1-phosphate uridylyltransferase [Ruminococcus sp.]
MTKQDALNKLQPYDQTHLLRFYDDLTERQQERLLSQIEQLDLSVLDQLHTEAEAKRGEFEPLGALTQTEITENEKYFRGVGLSAIRAGKVACVLLAGGQGSRLGFEHPKGMYNVGITKELYIFECLFRNLMDVTEEAGSFVHLMIMTSESNDEETRAFLEENHYFGYSKEYVHFFVQEMAPVIDSDHHILMTAPDQIAMSPNGNGGWFSSMNRAGLLRLIAREGIEWLNVFAVDNVLQRMADPVFVGATIDSKCTCGGKAVAKADPQERVGVLCLEDGKPSIVEYYEMTDAMIHQREPDGTLSYNYGVILNYLFRTDKLMDSLSRKLPLHMAHKQVAHIDEKGNMVNPEEPNAYKFETLVLDMIHMQESCLAYEVVREKEFAPIKNKTGVDSVESARALLEKNGVVL